MRRSGSRLQRLEHQRRADPATGPEPLLVTDEHLLPDAVRTYRRRNDLLGSAHDRDHDDR